MGLHFLDGHQYWTKKEAESSIRRNIRPKERKYFYVKKDQRPQYFSKDEWKQTYTIRVKDYSKILVVEH